MMLSLNLEAKSDTEMFYCEGISHFSIIKYEPPTGLSRKKNILNVLVIQNTESVDPHGHNISIAYD